MKYRTESFCWAPQTRARILEQHYSAALSPLPFPALSSRVQGVNDGNTPLKVLLMLTGSRGHAACPSGLLEPGMTSSSAVEARAAVSRCCLGLLVRKKMRALLLFCFFLLSSRRVRITDP